MMKGFAVEKTLDDDDYSNLQAFDPRACLFSISNPAKKKRSRSLPGNLDPNAEVIALSPKSLLATNKFVCEVCGKGFQRYQNLQLHRRGHNLPWKLKQRQNNEVVRRKVYICPEPSCSNHNPSRALGDLTGMKKHFLRKHGEKRWSCDKCSKKYAVLSDWKAHSKICGSKEYRCDCGTIFSRRNSFIAHKAFCEVLAAKNNTRTSTNPCMNNQNLLSLPHPIALHSLNINNRSSANSTSEISQWLSSTPASLSHHQINHFNHSICSSNICPLKPSVLPTPNVSATTMLQKAAEMGSIVHRPSEFHPLFSSNSQEWSDGVYGQRSSVSYPLQFQSFSSSSGFVYPFEEAVGGSTMDSKREGGRREDFMIERNINGNQARRYETTRDFLGLRVASHEELLSISEMATCMCSSSSSFR